jgi:outer membrane protein assembly factor BamB
VPHPAAGLHQKAFEVSMTKIKGSCQLHRHPSAKGLLIPFMAAAFGLFVLNAVAGDWPHWRGPQGNGISIETGLNWNWPAEGPKVLWKASVGKGFNSIAVAGGKACALGNAAEVDTVFCFDATTGKEIWKQSYPCVLDPLAHEGGPYATSAIDGNRLFTLSKMGHYFCWDLTTGSNIWSGQFTHPPTNKVDYKVWWGFAGSPLVLSNRVIYSSGDAGTALDKATGRVLWDNGPGRPGYSTPTLLDSGSQECFVFLGGHEVIAVETDKGRVRWRIPWKTTWDQNAPDVVITNHQMFVCSGHNVGCALFDISGETPKELWKNKNLRSQLSTPVLWNGLLFGYDENRLVCVDWQTGDLKWVFEDSRQGSLIVADGKLIAFEEDGLLRIIEASGEALKPVAKAKILEGRCWTLPVLANGLLYLRNAEGAVACVDLRR